MSSHLPQTRIKTIMKSSANVETVSKDSLQLVTLATELFIKHLAQKAAAEATGREIEYKHVAEIVNTSEKYEFLTEIIPRKITVMQYKELMQQKAAFSSADDSDTSDSESSSTTTDSSENESRNSEETEN